MNTCVQACIPLGNAWKRLYPRGVQAWKQVFISQAFPSLYMGNEQALKLLGTTNFIAVLVNHLSGMHIIIVTGSSPAVSILYSSLYHYQCYMSVLPIAVWVYSVAWEVST